ncbi:hypothetical protein [Streptomyces carpinensis]|uniref:hypothetical protein n=1 Tax=Streptomyces carpinensis TaxID=66369 RepID=UPI000A38A904|nr:hypothetical protein [Streptomyces carpinensis]
MALAVAGLRQQLQHRGGGVLFAAVEGAACVAGGVAVGADGQHASGRHQQAGLERLQVLLKVALRQFVEELGRFGAGAELGRT